MMLDDAEKRHVCCVQIRRHLYLFVGCAFSLGLLLHVSVGSIKHACSKTMKCVGSKRWPLGALTHPQPNLSEQNVLGDRVDDRVASRAQTLGEEGSAEAEAAATAAEAMPPTPPYIPPPRAAEAATAADAMVELSETQKHEDMDDHPPSAMAYTSARSSVSKQLSKKPCPLLSVGQSEPSPASLLQQSLSLRSQIWKSK